MNPNGPLNPHTEAVLKLRRQGLSYGEIGQRLGITRNAALGLGQRHGGKTAQTIASRTGLTLSDPYRADRLLRRFSWEQNP